MSKKSAKAWKTNNREQFKEYRRDYMRKKRDANPALYKSKVRNRTLKHKYGITLDLWEALFKSQGNRCAICRSPDPKYKGKTWATDHCHTTGKVRGILCHHCNHMLGSAEDNVETLASAIEYLRQAAS